MLRSLLVRGRGHKSRYYVRVSFRRNHTFPTIRGYARSTTRMCSIKSDCCYRFVLSTACFDSVWKRACAEGEEATYRSIRRDRRGVIKDRKLSFASSPLTFFLSRAIVSRKMKYLRAYHITCDMSFLVIQSKRLCNRFYHDFYKFHDIYTRRIRVV